MNKLVLIEKYLPSSIFWKNLTKDKRIKELSVEEVLDKYQGFEGELVFFQPINETDITLSISIKKCLELKKINNCSMLYVISDNKKNNFLRKKASQIGYDVGVCEEEKTIYSSIFHEILFGHLDQLVAFKDFLNEDLLFSDRSIAEKYVKLHDELSAQGMNVEDYEPMTIYEIWKQKE